MCKTETDEEKLLLETIVGKIILITLKSKLIQNFLYKIMYQTKPS